MIDGAFCGVGVANAFKQDLYIDKDVLMSYVDEFCQTYSGSDINTGILPSGFKTSLYTLVSIASSSITSLR